jgi:hypothetical protein
LPLPPNCTHAGNCADSTISTCSVCWRSAGFRNPSLDEARSSFARLSIVFTRTRNRRTWRNFLAKIRCAEPATLISRRSRAGVKVFGNCGPDRSLGSPWNWVLPRSSPPSYGTISSWAMAWPICPCGPAPPDRCLTMRRFRVSQTDPSLLRDHSFSSSCTPISLISGSSFSLSGMASPFLMYLRASSFRPIWT